MQGELDVFVYFKRSFTLYFSSSSAVFLAVLIASDNLRPKSGASGLPLIIR